MCKKKNTYDFIIVGSGPAGSCLAKRLSENGKYSVVLLEAGRDDSRVEQLLPEPSTANIPQPNDFQWGDYIRGGYNYIFPLISRGFSQWSFWAKDREDPKSRSLTYPRGSTWGGSSSINATLACRNAPYNWDNWAKLGLTEYSFDNIKEFYKLTENRSQKNENNQLYYDPAIQNGELGSFSEEYYGWSGMVPQIYQLTHKEDPFVQQFNDVIQNVLNVEYGFNYPINIDLDYPPTAKYGGTSLHNITATDQTGFIVPPTENSYVEFATYNYPLYNDAGFVIPPEFEKLLNHPIPVINPEGVDTLPMFNPLTGLNNNQRSSPANTYLYSAQTHKNFKIISEALVSKIITKKRHNKIRATGVEYLEGWNIYQTGRNPNASNCGFGGSPGDSKYNASLSKKHIKKIYAKKEVIVCGGFINSPQILMLSGIGDKAELEQFGIKSVKHIPGVGKSLVDNIELFIFWETDEICPDTNVTLSAKSTVYKEYPDYEIIINGTKNLSQIGSDPFNMKSWGFTKNIPCINQPFVSNNVDNILIDGTEANPPTSYKPIMVNPIYTMGSLIGKEEDNYSRGFIKLLSSDPTVAPLIVANYFSDPGGKDLDDFANIMVNNMFPIMLNFKSIGYFKKLLDPAPYDFLQDGITDFTNIDQIDIDKLKLWLQKNCGGHHGGGTCKMGLKNDPLAVVDQKCRVYGVKGLRVCDMSIVPISIKWPNSNLYPIAEKISKYILDKYNK